jgi:hypothetical protein
MGPPRHAVVFPLDEKSQIQALDRTRLGLPLKRGKRATKRGHQVLESIQERAPKKASGARDLDALTRYRPVNSLMSESMTVRLGR